MSAFSTPTQYNFVIPRQSNKKRARSKSDSNRKGRCHTSLFADDMIIYLEDLENSPK
jgi:hypothetical protein